MVPKIVLVFQTLKNKHPSYLFDIIPKVLSTRTTRNHNNIPLFNVKHEFFRNFFFPSTVTECNNLDNIRNSELVSLFKKQILKIIRPSPNSTFNVHNPHRIKLLTRLRLGQVICVNTNLDTISKTPQNYFATEVGILKQIFTSFSHCSNYSNQRKTLFENVSNIKRSLLNQNDSIIVETLLFVSNSLNDEENALKIESTIEYIITTERFYNSIVTNPLKQSTTSLEISN